MQTRFKNLKRGVVALASLGMAAGGFIVNTPAAQAAPNVRIVFTDNTTGQIKVWQNDAVTNQTFLADGVYDFASWCGNAAGGAKYVVAHENITGSIVRLTVDLNGNIGSPAQVYDNGFGLGSDPACSPDGTKVAFVIGDTLYTIPSAPNAGAATPIADFGDNLVTAISAPAWSPDGNSIAVSGDVGGGQAIYVVNANGFSGTRKSNIVAEAEDPTWVSNSRIYFEDANGDTDYINLGSLNSHSGLDDCSDPVAMPDGSGLLCVDDNLLRIGDEYLNFTANADQPDVESGLLPTPPVGNPPAGVCQLSADDLDFGNVKKGKSSTETVSVTNTGGAACNIFDVKKHGSSKFKIKDDDCEGTTLAVGASCDIDVKFKPTSKGSKSGSIEVKAVGSTVTIDLDGRGVKH